MLAFLCILDIEKKKGWCLVWAYKRHTDNFFQNLSTSSFQSCRSGCLLLGLNDCVLEKLRPSLHAMLRVVSMEGGLCCRGLEAKSS